MKVNFNEVLDVVKNNNGKVIILNGTACVGKTTTAVKLGEYLSYNLNIPILYFCFLYSFILSCISWIVNSSLVK